MYDLIVIGGGSGGIAAARTSANHGAKVMLIENDKLGGTCVNLGCVPKKLFYYASEFAEYFYDSKNYGWNLDVKNFDWNTLIKNKNKEIDRLNGIYEKLLNNSKVEFIFGDGSLIDSSTVQVNGKKYKAKKILIATGGSTNRPSIDGIEHAVFSDEAFFLKDLPKNITVVGGGYIAIEFAGIFKSLGCNVEMLVRSESLLKNFDNETVAFLQQEMKKRGIKFRFNTEVNSIKKLNKGFEIDAGKEIVKTDLVFIAAGRVPNSDNLNLEKIGVEIGSKKEIIVDEYSRTNVKNIFAVGDVTNRVNLTPVAINEGRAFADSEFGKNKRKIDHRNIPSVVFSQPNLGYVGLTEEECAQQKIKVDIYVSDFRPLKNNISGNTQRTFMKLIVNSKTDKIIGIQMVGDESGEIIQGFAVALKCGATKKDFDSTVAIHPTAAEEFVTMRTKTRSN
ncbi:MAG: glutathione-disulfide reductase [Rickettsiales bacterium]